MMVSVRVQPRASRSRIEKIGNGSLKAYLTVPPVDGKANEALRGALAGYFGVSKTRIKIKRGARSKNKQIEIC
ncbi:MAG: DUF167 domain-containing protein [Candidatus Omnitrophota bacterium]